ncbi:hypothetical protein [Streptomonospora wellingtoniae]|uniref:Uncharacterized protein n=1 Tax=Streptomonospora wellingtoniae TaxID=3075544 RepID=A0ABU2KQV4_9ACTN|nr:hypothetical protein [Streptomonospora sp. DSM 45055]MDT0301655.1 hypothetical protein [Streptomonospora sp. DSM 45055]
MEPTPTKETVELTTESGTLRRRGEWVVPRLLRIRSQAGAVRLDMSQARIAHPVVDIELSVLSGSIVLVLPDGATADLDRLHSPHASHRSRVPAVPTHQAPHFVLSGETYTGALRVRYARGHRRR